MKNGANKCRFFMQQLLSASITWLPAFRAICRWTFYDQINKRERQDSLLQSGL
ncbi:MAG: hypothetical protein RL607_2428 [Bacteroidota bacterium]